MILSKEKKGANQIDGVRTLGLSKIYKSMTGGADV